jgi:hypothetical protein
MNPIRWKALFFLFIMICITNAQVLSQGIKIDHSCTDTTKIPDIWIQKIKTEINLHFAHTSHGLQILEGLKRLSDPSLSVYDARLDYTLKRYELPDSETFDILGGQRKIPYVTPEEYWKDGGDLLTREILDAYPTINVSMFCWCRELDRYSKNDVDAYLKKIDELEKDFPDVVFIYMTGNAQAKGPGAHNRYLRNEQIRNYCRENNKFLYDFADIDVWHNSEKWMYTHEGKTSPREHPFFRREEYAHTSYTSCEIKGKALWWLMARIVGWNPE